MGSSWDDVARDVREADVRYKEHVNDKTREWVSPLMYLQNLHPNDEMPQHEVHIAQSFAFGKYPVTRGEFAVFVQETGYQPKGVCPFVVLNPSPAEFKKARETSWQNPGFDQTDRDPVVCVTVHDAEAYVAWLNTKVKNPASTKGTGPYRLPSEAEWEYAARAGTRTAYWWGNSIGSNNAVCDDCGSRWDSKTTVPVGSFKPNPFGLYDVHGNVFEWMADCKHKGYSGAPTDGSAWTTEDCKSRVIRGGSWRSNQISLRSAASGFLELDDSANYVGFRLARTLQ